MEMEHINKNTIRVLIDNADLSARGITILDLLGDHKQIEDFFYSILKEVDTDHQFQNNDSVTFQVMPTNDGLELFISKTDPNSPEDDQAINNEEIARYIKKRLMRKNQDQQAGAETVQPQQPSKTNTVDVSPRTTKEPHQPTRWKVVAFNSFENLIDFARIAEDEDIVSELYKYDHRYYLALKYFQSIENDNLIKDNLALAYEYGNPTAVTPMVLGEHGKKLMSVSALHTIRHYFA